MTSELSKKINRLIDNFFAKIDNLFTRKSQLTIIALFLLLFFVDILREFYNKTIILPLLSKVPSSLFTLFVFQTLCAFLILLFHYYLRKNKQVSNWLFKISAILFLLFLSARFSHLYNFSPYAENGLKYFDIIFVVFVGIFLLKLRSWLIKNPGPRYYHNPFRLDLPLRDSTEDLYKRKEFAYDLAMKIQSKLENENSGALAVGINGEWGSGKTSFCNFIKEKIEKKNRIILDFNPWRSSSPEKIIEDFFELLISEIKKFDPELSNEITKYAKTLTKISENTITKVVETLSDFLFTVENKNENYEMINESIQGSKRQIVIFIDDLDRLDKREITEVLRLIRNTANFNNIVYVVSYDKAYLLEAIKRFNKTNHQSFLEKIFQFEFLLPKYEQAILRNEIKSILKLKLGTHENPYINAAVDYAGISGKNITNRIIKTQRDVIRFTNSFSFEIRRVRNEVNIVDFYFVQLLKLKFTSIYKFISTYNDQIFIRVGEKFRLRTVAEKDKNDDIFNPLHLLDEPENKIKTTEETFFQNYLLRNVSHKLNNIEKDVILEIVNELLKEKPLRSDSASLDYKSFALIANFHKYFTIQLLETDFSAYDFELARFEDYEIYNNKIFEWINQGRISDVLERLEKIIDFTSFQEWENHLKILTAIANHQRKQTGSIGINYKQIFDTLNYPMAKPQIKIFSNKEAYLNFLIVFFQNAEDPYVIESNILTGALTTGNSLHLTDDEISNQLFEYLNKYCTDHKMVTDDFRVLHKNCVKRSKTNINEYQDIPEAEELFKKHFLKYLTGSQLAGFIKQTNPGKNIFQLDWDWLNIFFSRPEDFDEYLNTEANIRKDTNDYNEFLEFNKKFSNNNRLPIEFDFKYINPNRWSF